MLTLLHPAYGFEIEPKKISMGSYIDLGFKIFEDEALKNLDGQKTYYFKLPNIYQGYEISNVTLSLRGLEFDIAELSSQLIDGNELGFSNDFKLVAFRINNNFFKYSSILITYGSGLATTFVIEIPFSHEKIETHKLHRHPPYEVY